MPILSNSRHELFAIGIANGKSFSDAYIDAGFKPNGANASTLHKNTNIQLRIAEIQQERAEKTTQRYVAETDYTRARLLTYLEKAMEIAIEKENSVGVTQATVAMARITGQIIDRREVGEVGAFDGLTDEELVRKAAEKAKELGVPHLKLVDDGEEDEEKTA